MGKNFTIVVTLNRVTQWSLEIVTNMVPLNSYNYST